MIDTWTISGCHFTCEVEYWSGDGSKARAYWNYGTDKKFGGPGKSGYFIEIKMVPQAYWLSKKIHGWIRLVRPFKGPFGLGSIDQFWKTGMTGQEEEIIEEVKNVIKSGGPGAAFEKGRLEIRARQGKLEEEKWQSLKAKLDLIANKRFKKDVLELNEKQQEEVLKIHGKKVQRTRKPRKKVEADGTLHEDIRKERQKIRTRKAAKVAAKAVIVCVVAIAAVFVLGNGEISLPDMPVLLPDLLESIPNLTQSCEVYDSIRITSGTSQGKISLMSCTIKNKEMLTVSGELSQSSQINLTLLNPDMKKIQDVTFVKKEFSHTIGEELYSKDDGKWRINVIVGGKLQGALKFMVG